MTGTITKKNLLTTPKEIWNMGGARLFWAVLTAPKGSTFLEVYFATITK